MLEERADPRKDEYIRRGVMIGKTEGRAEDFSIGRGLGLACGFVEGPFWNPSPFCDFLHCQFI